MIVLNWLNTVFVLACVSGVIGCGKETPSEPVSAPIPAVSTDAEGNTTEAIPDPASGKTYTTLKITNFFNQNTVCTALKNWDTSDEIIVFPRSVTLVNDLTFKDGKVFQTAHGAVVNEATDQIGNLTMVLHNNSPGCTVVILGGILSAVNP